MQKKKIVWIVEHCETKGTYAFERAVTLAKLLQEETVFLFIRTNNTRIINSLAQTKLNIILFDHFHEVKKKIRELQPNTVFCIGINK